ncbi:MAG TPA: PDZ domain-containing protein [Gemmatimonadales bacterium]|jgi:predicted metalloprotease with PDZ domain|nr:PDZ domain-containing protein [Gemmatimonadales bacterium]
MISARSFVLGALSTASVWPAVVIAQERRPESRPRIYISGDSTMRDRIRMVTQRRARLGVTVDLRASTNDSIGATIESVTPGGPAARAGLKSGDIITKLDGKVVTANAGEKAGMDESLPGLRLVEIAAQLKPHDTVSVEYRREGARKTVSLVTGDEPVMSFEFPEGFDRGMLEGTERAKVQMERMLPRSGSGHLEFGPGGGAFAFAFGGPLMDLELAPLNNDLGQYFGTTEGVLVIDVPKESSLGLKGGDVILSIDGRKATGPSSLLRIMRSYDPGESFKLEIMRNKARMTVSGKLDKPREE